MKKQLNRYNFDKIGSVMAKEFGTIKKGTENDHLTLLNPMENSLLKLHRKDKNMDGRRAIEAIHICLLTIDGYLSDCEYDFSKFLTEEIQDFVTELLMAFDPFTNKQIIPIKDKPSDLKTPEFLREYFEEPIICLLRIKKSIEFWTKEGGANGYFDFLEKMIGAAV